MNTPKIAALYANSIFNTLLRFPSFDPSTTLTQQVMEHVLREARVTSEDGRRYQVEASYVNRRERYTYKNDVGDRAGGFLSETLTKRAADWMLSQIPGWPGEAVARLHKDVPEQDVLVVSVMGYGRRDETPENDIETRAGLCFAGKEDLEILLRGIASIRRKRRKQAKKLEAQLRAYHQQQLAEATAKEQADLRKGHWRGAEKALTTAARVDEPGVPFLGDLNLSDEQRRALGLSYWAVPADAGMEAAFPAGTGISLKPIHRSRELVEGAVYFYECKWSATDATMILGRARLADRSRGSITLQCDDRSSAFSMPLEWNNPMLKVFRVMHYTTRSAEPVAEVATASLHQPQLRGQRQQRRELQAA
ncbi:MAG: hypothetical protein ACRYFZ_28180 [Janthinobacterium lividum]